MGGNEKICPNIMFRRHIQMDFISLKIKTFFIIYFYFAGLWERKEWSNPGVIIL